MFANHTTTAKNVNSFVVSVKGTTFVTIWLDIVRMDVNRIGTGQGVMVRTK